MSPIGKIFTVLNLVLAGLFLGWAVHAASNGQNLKQELAAERTAHQAATKALGTEKSTLVAKVQELENQKARLMSERDDAQATAERHAADLKKEAARNGELNASVTKIETTLEGLVASKDKMAADMLRATQAQNDAEKAQAAAEAAQREAESKLADMTQKFGTAEASIADLERTRESLKKDMAKVQNQLDTVVSQTGYSLANVTAMPLVEGRVISVVTNPAPGMVAINKGKTSNVSPGFTFEIYDGQTYKGQVRVDYVQENTCSAVIVRSAPGQTIRQGDSASTRL
jgi:hypothetical protein